MAVAAAPRVADLKQGGWLAEPGFGIYVHIPFCRHRCHYCDFNTYEGLDGLHQPYVTALIDEIVSWEGERRAVTSVFFGGGTPTLLPPEDNARILAAIRSSFEVAHDAEVTIEANPETVDEASLARLRAAGFNRVSIGVQSLVGAVLARLGRTHGPGTALDAVAAARRAGFEEVNVDLIYGAPWETEHDWRASLEGAVQAQPDHLSAYALTVEQGTPLATMVATGRESDVDPDIQAERHGLACEVLGAAGYDRYEISNWARPGKACAHNLLYWSAGDHLAFGAGAHGHVAGERWWNVRLPRDYIARSPRSIDGRERLDPGARAGEALMLGLRLRTGIELGTFAVRFGAEHLDMRREVFSRLASLGLVGYDGGRLRLTERGTMVANEVASRLL